MIPSKSVMNFVVPLLIISALFVANISHIVYAPPMKGGGKDFFRESRESQYKRDTLTSSENLQKHQDELRIKSLREKGQDPGVQSSALESIPKEAYPNSRDGTGAHDTKLKDLLHKLDELSSSLQVYVKDSTWKDAREFSVATFRPLVDKIEVPNFIVGMLNFGFTS